MHDADARAMIDDLSHDEREQVVRIFGPELRAGWIPKPADIAAGVRLVRALRQGRQASS